MTEQTELLGYRIERTGNDALPYYLHGKRGAVYGLFRYRATPQLLYARDRNGCVARLKGNAWFTDRTGELETVN